VSRASPAAARGPRMAMNLRLFRTRSRCKISS
jgi:hypothetical protein